MTHIQRHFSNASTTYDSVSEIQAQAGTQLLSLLPASFHPTSIADLGCGTGRLTHHLSKVFPEAQVTGIDFSEAMIQVAKERTTPNLRFETANFQTWSPPRSFDLIYSNAALHWSPDFDETLYKICRHLSPKGLLAFSTMGPKTFQELRKSLEKTFDRPWPVAASRFPTLNSIVKSIKHGLSRLEYQEKQHKITYPDIKTLLTSIKKTGIQGNPSYSGLWTSSKIKKLEEVYLKEWGSIQVTYEIFYFIAHAQ